LPASMCAMIPMLRVLARIALLATALSLLSCSFVRGSSGKKGARCRYQR